MYQVELTRDAEKYLSSCPTKMREHLLGQLASLEENPREHGLLMVGEFRGLYRCKLYHKGVQYRALYDIFEEKVSVLVLMIDKREHIYERAHRKKLARS